MGEITFLVGGARSGKSALAVEIGRRHDGDVLFLATAEPFDDDLRERVARHRADRPAWPTIEEPLEIAATIVTADQHALLILDCLTVWVATALHHGLTADAAPIVRALQERQGPSVVVSNEVGMGVIPAVEMARDYREVLGRANQLVAAAATCTLLMVAGRAVRLHDPLELLP